VVQTEALMLTIAYFTSRRMPMFEWFADSLNRETGGNYDGIRIVVVDRHVDREDRRTEIKGALCRWLPANPDFWHVAPKPTVWQGPGRLTKEDWFAASNARNTAICLAPDGHIAFVDDLSVLMPGWFAAVRRAIDGPALRITCGAYRKVRDLVVDGGNVVSFTDHPGGIDNRFALGNDERPVACEGNWMYGCSLVARIEAFLSINGFPEAWCDGMGFEDCIAGIMLEKQGYEFVYDRRMLTYESDELHGQLPVMKRSDFGLSPNDKSHAVLNAARNGNGWHPNYFGDDGLRGLRARILAGDPFPPAAIPEHEWFSGTRLSEL
jgi:hypothetical protein